MKRTIFAVALFAALLLAGCFETNLSLGPRESAKVDTKYVGQWHYSWTDSGEAKTAELVVLNFNGHEYYVEWTDGKEPPLRMSGFLVDVKGASFAHLQPLSDDGELEDKNLIVRIELKDGKLLLHHLNEHFFDGITTNEALQKRVAENLDKAEMYDGDAMAGTKVQMPKPH
jgi:hypothetical protein